LINGKFYFILHAPRQSGKTTYLKALTDQINRKGDFYSLYCTLDPCQGITDLIIAIRGIIAQINMSLMDSSVSKLSSLAFPEDSLPSTDPTVMVISFLKRLCVNIDKDLVVFFDEADGLSEEPLISFLRQIRVGYNNRYDSHATKFPRSMALVGLRDIRDYLVHVRPESESKKIASPFNIKKKALTLANFTQDEIGNLYRQHTEASGQVFEDSAIERAWHWSEGQPWLVNALAYEAVVEILKNDYSKAVTADIIEQAAEALIKRRDAHIDSLLERLKEPRVIRVMDSVFAGTPAKSLKNPDDRQYCLDLGLVVEDNGKLRPANAIYQEVMSRVLTDEIQSALDERYTNIIWSDGQTLFISKILEQFQDFWRQNAFTFPLRINEVDSRIDNVIRSELKSLHLATELSDEDSFSFVNRVKEAVARMYDEAAYSLLLMAFVQKVVNGGALVFRQYSQGRGVVDLCVQFNGRKYLLEVKLAGQSSLESNLNQLARYMDTSGVKEGWLVIFDQNRNKSWEEKITWKKFELDNKSIIHIVGC
jgi:hypothetical protein